MKYIINENQIGYLTRNGKFEKVLTPGAYRYAGAFGYEVRVVSALREVNTCDIPIKKLCEDDFFAKNKGEFYFASTKAKHIYSDVTYPDGAYLFFGKETKGLPEALLAENYDRAIRIPMIDEARSLNLSNSVAIVVYEALRQQGFPNMLTEGHLTQF